MHQKSKKGDTRPLALPSELQRPTGAFISKKKYVFKYMHPLNGQLCEMGIWGAGHPAGRRSTAASPLLFLLCHLTLQASNLLIPQPEGIGAKIKMSASAFEEAGVAPELIRAVEELGWT